MCVQIFELTADVDFNYYPFVVCTCSGQIIRIWGRPPFAPGGQVPPPLRPGELFWQALFKQPQQPQQVHCTTMESVTVTIVWICIFVKLFNLFR